jgi:hypothetical protein
MIQTPEEFKKICRNMVPDIARHVKNEDEFVVMTLIGLDDNDAIVVVPFLKSLLGSHAPQEIKEWMWSMPGSIGFSDADQLIRYLNLLLRKLQGQPFAP